MIRLSSALLVAAAAFPMAAAHAQTAPSSAVPGKNAPVVTDVAPAPPEDRSSTGAIVLDQAPVRAQREAQGRSGGAATGKPTQTQGAGPLPPAAVRDALRGTGLEDPPAKAK